MDAFSGICLYIGTVLRTSIGGFLAQQTGNELNVYERISQSFRDGPDPRPIYIGTIVLIVTLVIGYWLLRVYTDMVAPSDSKEQKVSILEGIKQNIKLSNKQERYLQALIEKFQDQHPYDPEIKTEYLEQFLFFALQSLTHAPDRAIRRKTHYVPDFKKDELLEIMFKLDDTSYTTEKCNIFEQKDDSVVINKPGGVDPTQFREGREISTAYHKGELTLRGQAEIRHVMDQKLLIVFPEGLHFEEHRTYERIRVDDIPCQLILQEFEGDVVYIDGRIEDLSVGGAGVVIDEVDERIHENMRGRFQFELSADREMDFQVAVVHRVVNEAPGGMELGLQFIEPGLANREYLHNFLDGYKSN